MGEIRMSKKERRRMGIMARIDVGEINLKDASDILGISYRQIKLIRARYRQHGDAGLVHRNRGGTLSKSRNIKNPKFNTKNQLAAHKIIP